MASLHLTSIRVITLGCMYELALNQAPHQLLFPPFLLLLNYLFCFVCINDGICAMWAVIYLFL